ncbi:exosortase-associated protein EpsI, B-type [Ferribacterium limneticum]|uniref:exosortase-associated protein EpsI, B-type n=1 Tax=Ferribacterium limneticum TaxID=76259 RepID=UPI001CF8F6F3|nr:exosortase-associated protein EpsI, B-type [Ferribacterium limneticum]UCV24653.1 EpsI family protein [Ferribacterium limneticum]
MNLPIRNIILLVLMLASAGLAVAMRPTHKIADQGPKVVLETMIPHAFGEWQEKKQSGTQIVDPQTKEMLDKIYSQTLSRTYVNGSGYRIMLSIAYGNDQSDSMQVHKPEVCYPAQGFALQGKQSGTLIVKNGEIPVIRILTTLGQRSEPVTYWTTIGDQVVKPGIHKKLAEMSYGLSGKIPDGMLIRVSSIDAQSDNAYQIQNRFAAQMLEALAPEHRQRLTGNLQPN